MVDSDSLYALAYSLVQKILLHHAGSGVNQNLTENPEGGVTMKNVLVVLSIVRTRLPGWLDG